MPTRNTNYTDLYLNRPGQIDPLVPNTPTQDYTAYGTMMPPVRTMQDPSFATDPFRGMGQAFAGQMGSQVMAPPTPVDLNEQVAYTDKTFQEMRLAAEKSELDRLSRLRENQRQTAAMQGSTMYEQARMSMAQRQLMSDTRGLTGGAQEFAQTGATAQEQMVLTQIKMGTAQQLLDIDSQSLQDPRIALEYGARVSEIAKQDDPRIITAEGVLSQAQTAYEAGNIVEYQKLMNDYYTQINQMYGSTIPTGPGVDPATINQALVSKISDIANERTTFAEIAGWAGALGIPAIAGGVGVGSAKGVGAALAGIGGKIAAKGVIGKVASTILVGAGGIIGGKVLIGLAIAGAVIWAGSQVVKEIDRSTRGDAAVSRVAQELQKERTRLTGLGYTNEQVDAIIEALKEQAGLPPKYANVG